MGTLLSKVKKFIKLLTIMQAENSACHCRLVKYIKSKYNIRKQKKVIFRYGTDCIYIRSGPVSSRYIYLHDGVIASIKICPGTCT